MNEEDFFKYYFDDSERNRNVHRLIDGEFDGSLGDDGLPDFDYEQRVQKEIEWFEDNILNYMREQTIRLANEWALEHSVNFLCMN